MLPTGHAIRCAGVWYTVFMNIYYIKEW